MGLLWHTGTRGSSVLGLVMKIWGPHPSSFGISGLQEPDLGSQEDDQRSGLGM